MNSTHMWKYLIKYYNGGRATMWAKTKLQILDLVTNRAAVRSIQAVKPTVSELENMKHSGQTKKDLRVYRIDDVNFRVDNKITGYTVRYWNAETNEFTRTQNKGA